MNEQLAVILIAKGFAWMLGVLLIRQIFRRASASVRHRILALGLVGVALLPLLSLRLPQWEVELPSSPVVSQLPPNGPGVPAETGVAVSPRNTAEFSPPATPLIAPVSTPPKLPERISSAVPLILVWFLGLLVSAVRLGGAIWATVKIARRARTTTLDSGLKLPARTRLLQSDEVSVAATFGWLRPVILLPVEFQTLPPESQRAVLAHESAHIRRADWAWLVFARIISGVYWFNPLVKLAERQLRLDCEQAADDAVLRDGVEPTSYAELLLNFVTPQNQRKRLEGALPIAGGVTVVGRIEALLADNQNRKQLGRFTAITGAAICLGFLIPLAISVLKEPDNENLGSTLGGMEVIGIAGMHRGKLMVWDRFGAILPNPPRMRPDTRAISLSKNPNQRLIFVRRWVPDGTVPQIFELGTNARLEEVSGEQALIEPPYSSSIDARGGVREILRVSASNVKRRLSIFRYVGTGDWVPEVEWKGNGRDAKLQAGPNISVEFKDGQTLITPRDQFVKREVRMVMGDARDQVILNGFIDVERGFDWGGQRVGRVRIMSRSLKKLVIRDVALEPDVSRSHRPILFEPNNLVADKGGSSKLADGTAVKLTRFRWLSDFDVAKRLNQYRLSPNNFDSSGLKPFELQISHFTRQLWSLNGEIFDDEGRGLLVTNGMVTGDDSSRKIEAVVWFPESQRSTGVVVKLQSGPVRTIRRGFFNKTPGFTSWFKSSDIGNRFGATFPVIDPALLLTNEQVIVALDSQGREIFTGLNGCGIGDGQIKDMNLGESPERMKQVKGIAIQLRPFQWVRFSNLKL